MHMINRFSGVIAYAMFAALIAMTTAAYLEKQLEKDVRSSSSSSSSSFSKKQNFVGGGGDRSEKMLNDAPSSMGGGRSYGGRYDHLQKRQSFSVTQDLDALAEMLREAAMRRRLQNAINFFNALKKRDIESTYGSHMPPPMLPEQLANNIRK